MPLRVIDTHLHIWKPSKLHYSWLNESAGLLYQDFNLEDIAPELKSANIDGAILVQAANTAEETAFLLEVAAAQELVKGVVGWLPLLNPNQTALALQVYQKNSCFKGVRHLIHEEPDPNWLLQESVLESLKEVARLGYHYEIVGSFQEHVPVALRVAEKIPELKIVINHLGNPTPATASGFKAWKDTILRASENPQVYTKISGLSTNLLNRDTWNSDDLRLPISFAIACFGTHRIFLGSDWPVCELAGSFRKIWLAYQTVLKSLLCEIDLIKIRSGNAHSFYNLQAEPALA